MLTRTLSSDMFGSVLILSCAEVTKKRSCSTPNITGRGVIDNLDSLTYLPLVSMLISSLSASFLSPKISAVPTSVTVTVTIA